MVKRTKKVCQVCGKPFYGGRDCFYCPKCAKDKKVDTVVKIRVCQECGIEFYGGPRAKRCPDCAYTVKINYKQKPTMRPIGSIDKCVICGNEYSVASGRQKYCSEACQRMGVLEWQREHKKEYYTMSGQSKKREARRQQAKKICIYCLGGFSSSTATNVCSDYCRSEQKKLQQCMVDINRGYKRNLEKYVERRNKYREERQNDK